MEKITQPGLSRFFIASAACWWIAGFMNPGFFAVAIMLLVMVPLLLAEFYLSVPARLSADERKEAKPDPEVELLEAEDSA